jgi:hypothetical protein
VFEKEECLILWGWQPWCISLDNTRNVLENNGQGGCSGFNPECLALA